MNTAEQVVAALSNKKRTAKGWIVADCPFCGKPAREEKFGFHPETGRYKCHAGKCGASGTTAKLAKHLKIETRKEEQPSGAPDWIYTDKDGNALYGVKRYAKAGKKSYAQYHFDAHSKSWKPGLNGTARTLYRLPEVIKADTVFVVEGEKCADRIRAAGAVATTCSGGAGKWEPRFAEHLRGKTVYVLPDNDEPGRAHAEQVFNSLFKVASRYRIVNLPGLKEKGDVFDWFESGKTLEDLQRLCEEEQSEADHFSGEAARHKRLTDTGNAEQFVARYQDRARFCHSWGDWLLWDGQRWRKDEVGAVEALAKDCVDAIWSEVKEYGGDRYSDELKRWAKRSRNASGRSNLLSLARSEPALSITNETLDAHRDWLNCENGTLDLSSGELLPHEQDNFLTKLCPVRFDAQAEAPRWIDFVETIFGGDESLMHYVQKAAGYSLTGDVSQQCFFFLYGLGANGKSVFVETLLSLLGDYATKTSIQTLMARDGDGSDANPALVALQGARLVVSSEIEEGKRWNESLVKDLTGGDRITARPLYGAPLTFTPEFKLWVYGNHKPTIRGADAGIQRRIKLIPFSVTIPESKRDPKLKLKLAAERAGILNWALAGLRMIEADGFEEPAVVRDATRAYIQDQDALKDWIEECVELCYVPGTETLQTALRIANAELYANYANWCDKRRQFTLSHKALTQRLLDRGFAQSDERGRPWIGLRLRA